MLANLIATARKFLIQKFQMRMAVEPGGSWYLDFSCMNRAANLKFGFWDCGARGISRVKKKTFSQNLEFSTTLSSYLPLYIQRTYFSWSYKTFWTSSSLSRGSATMLLHTKPTHISCTAISPLQLHCWGCAAHTCTNIKKTKLQICNFPGLGLVLHTDVVHFCTRS